MIWKWSNVTQNFEVITQGALPISSMEKTTPVGIVEYKSSTHKPRPTPDHYKVFLSSFKGHLYIIQFSIAQVDNDCYRSLLI